MQTRSFIDKLGDLDEEITKVCRAADVMCKGAGKNHTDCVGRLKEACDALEEKQKYVREAKDCLLGLDGFMHAMSGNMRQLMEHPTMGSAVGKISERMQHPMSEHVAAIVECIVGCLRRVGAAVKDLREAKQEDKRSEDVKASAKALTKICGAAEKALRKAMKHSQEPPKGALAPDEEPPSEEMEEEAVVEKAAGDVGYHGYNLTAGLPPEFLKNIKKKDGDDDKDDEKKDDDEKKKGCKTADSLTPGNESKGPKDEGEEDEGWVPGHRTTKKPKGEKKATDDDYIMALLDGIVAKHAGYDLTETVEHGYDLFS